MTTISRWIVPSYFTEEKHKTDELIFDLTDHLKLMLKNEVWNRKFDYGFSTGLKNTNQTEIKSAVIKVYPRFISGYVNEKRIPEIIEKVCGKIATHLKVKSQIAQHRAQFLVILRKQKIVHKHPHGDVTDV